MSAALHVCCGRSMSHLSMASMRCKLLSSLPFPLLVASAMFGSSCSMFHCIYAYGPVC